jgi:D-serine deaminase-like pyridoxal phosphate-dependent protein
MQLDWKQICSPTLILDEEIAKANIAAMVQKSARAGVSFRPHFKTHQSAEIGEWFREMGVNKITVSSVGMAEYFVQAGWQDIFIAFPVNLREHQRLNGMAAQVSLAVLLDSEEAMNGLSEKVFHRLSVWIEIDSGNGRSGMPWDNPRDILKLARRISGGGVHHFAGLMGHAGNTYAARGKSEVLAVHEESLEKMRSVRHLLNQEGVEVHGISIGDTPSCSLADDFSGATELRPGNLVFYDLMQQNIGACEEAQIGIALACPVVAKYPERGELILHGGAVHLGKDFLQGSEGKRNFGHLAWPDGIGWSKSEPNCSLISLSQEHGVAKVSPTMMQKVNIGDLLLVLPVHSCLTADLMGEFTSAASMARGTPIHSMRTRIAGYLNEIARK